MQTFFQDPKFFGPTFFFTLKIFLDQKYFLDTTFFSPKFFLPKIFWNQNFFWRQLFCPQIFFDQEFLLGVLILLLLVHVLVTGIKQSQILVWRLSLDFDKCGGIRYKDIRLIIISMFFKNLIHHFDLLISRLPNIVQKNFCTPDEAIDPTFPMNYVPAF